MHNAVFYDRILEVASANLGGAACFAGSRDWITALFRESFPEDCPATVDRRLLANFIQRAAYHGVRRGLIVPKPAPLNN
jgi:hypothetical protein